MQFLVGFDGCNSLALVTLEKQDTFFNIPREIQNTYCWRSPAI